MSFSDQTSAAMRLLPGVHKDRRRTKRVNLSLDGRFLNEDSEDFALKTTNLSCSGALITAETLPSISDNIICYFDDLGRVAASVIRVGPEGFAVRFRAAQHKRDKIADRLTWLLNKSVLGLPDDRSAKRYRAGGPALVTRKDGRQVQCRVLDISLTGASFQADGPAPLVGENVVAGNLNGEVVRSQGGVFAIRYLHKNG